MVGSNCQLIKYLLPGRLPYHNTELVDAMTILGQLVQVKFKGIDLSEAQLLINGLASGRGFEIGLEAFCVGNFQHRDYQSLCGAPLEILCRRRNQ